MKMKWRRKKKKEEGLTCGGFEAVLLAVADQRTAWTVVGLSPSSLCFFFYFVSVFSVFLLLPTSVCCFSFLLLFLMVAAVVSGEMVVLLFSGEQCLLLQQTMVADSGYFFFFMLPSAFSAPLLCLFCSSLFNLWLWRCCRWWLGGTVGALVVVQWG